MQPLASLKALADPIYEAFYGLSEQPFAITTDPKFFYLSISHQRAFNEVLNGLKRREGLLLLTGETGTGKTTLVRAVVDALGGRTFSALVLNPYMSGAEVLRIVLRDFGLISHEELRRGAIANADIPQLLDTLEGFLESVTQLDGYAVIILDEAQSIAPETLDQIRVLTGLERQGQPLVQVVLCGQPALLTTLKADSLSALNERITRRVSLLPLPPLEVEPYIKHRLSVAGGGDTLRFDAGAAHLVAELSHGLPRRVNVLCDRALQEGRIEGVSTITAALVKRAARSIAGAHDPVPVAEVEPAPAAEAAPAPSGAADDVMLTLGQVPARPGRMRRFVLVAAGGLVTAAVLSYGYFAMTIVNTPVVVPAAPPRPVLDVGAPMGPVPVPSADAVSAIFAPASAAPPPPAASTPTSPTSGQLPH